MARTLEELDAAVSRLRLEVNELHNNGSNRAEILQKMAGCFTGDEHWAAINAAIEKQRRQPDPELSGE